MLASVITLLKTFDQGMVSYLKDLLIAWKLVYHNVFKHSQ